MVFPLTRRYGITIPAVLASGTLTTPFDPIIESETVSSVLYVPSGSMTGASGNNRTLTCYNRGATTGTGTTIVAQLTLVSGTNVTDNVPVTVPLSTTSANLLLTANCVLEWESLPVGTGIADVGGRAVVNTVRTAS